MKETLKCELSKCVREVQAMRVYLDNCCFNRPYDDQSQLKVQMETQAKLEIQQQIRNGNFELATSYILEAENAVNPFERKRLDIQSFIDKHTKVFVSENQDKAVREQAAKIMETGIRLMDACHIACAMLSQCDVFLSTDKRVLKYQSETIRIMNPVMFVMERSGGE